MVVTHAKVSSCSLFVSGMSSAETLLGSDGVGCAGKPWKTTNGGHPDNFDMFLQSHWETWGKTTQPQHLHLHVEYMQHVFAWCMASWDPLRAPTQPSWRHMRTLWMHEWMEWNGMEWHDMTWHDMNEWMNAWIDDACRLCLRDWRVPSQQSSEFWAHSYIPQRNTLSCHYKL